MKIKKLLTSIFAVMFMLGGVAFGMEEWELSQKRKQEIEQLFTTRRSELICDQDRSEEMAKLPDWYDCLSQMNQHLKTCNACLRAKNDIRAEFVKLKLRDHLGKELEIWKDCVGFSNEYVKALKQRLKHRDAHLNARINLRKLLNGVEEYRFAFQQAVANKDYVAQIAIANAHIESLVDDPDGEKLFAIARKHYDLLSRCFQTFGYEKHKILATQAYQAAARQSYAPAELVEIIKSDMNNEKKKQQLQELVDKTNYPEAIYYIGKKRYVENDNIEIGMLLKDCSGVVEKNENGENSLLLSTYLNEKHSNRTVNVIS